MNVRFVPPCRPTSGACSLPLRLLPRNRVTALTVTGPATPELRISGDEELPTLAVALAMEDGRPHEQLVAAVQQVKLDGTLSAAYNPAKVRRRVSSLLETARA